MCPMIKISALHLAMKPPLFLLRLNPSRLYELDPICPVKETVCYWFHSAENYGQVLPFTLFIPLLDLTYA